MKLGDITGIQEQGALGDEELHLLSPHTCCLPVGDIIRKGHIVLLTPPHSLSSLMTGNMLILECSFKFV